MNTMKRAHEIRQEAATKWDCKTSEIIFSICLKMAWSEGKGDKMEASMIAYDGKIQIGGLKRLGTFEFVTIILPLKISDVMERDIRTSNLDATIHPNLLGGFRVYHNVDRIEHKDLIDNLLAQ